MVFTEKLTNLQIELIKLFAYQVSDNQILEIKDLLAKYFAEVASKEMDKLWEENQWNDQTMEDWLNEHNRTPYLD
jgi:hypothetical protein